MDATCAHAFTLSFRSEIKCQPDLDSDQDLLGEKMARVVTWVPTQGFCMSRGGIVGTGPRRRGQAGERRHTHLCTHFEI